MIDDKHEYEWQQRATAHPRTDRDAPAEADVDRYRLVYRAIREAPLPELPTDFALQMERLTQDAPEPVRDARRDEWVVRLAFAVAAGAALVSAIPILAKVQALLGTGSADVPWPLLLATVGSLLLVSIADRRRQTI